MHLNDIRTYSDSGTGCDVGGDEFEGDLVYVFHDRNRNYRE